MSKIKEAMTDQQVLGQQIEENFDRFDFFTGRNHSKSYFIVGLIPNITFIMDNQMNETFSFHDEFGKVQLYPSCISFSIIVDWLGFYAEATVNFKTNKPVMED